jgi:hypothetical protein
VLKVVLKSKDVGFGGKIISIGAPEGINVISRFAEDVESGDIDFNVSKGDVVFTGYTIAIVFGLPIS